MELLIQCPEFTAIGNMTQFAASFGGTMEKSQRESWVAGRIAATRSQSILSWNTEHGLFKFDRANLGGLFLGQAQHMGRFYPALGLTFASQTETSRVFLIVCQTHQSEWLKENGQRIAEWWGCLLDDEEDQ